MTVRKILLRLVFLVVLLFLVLVIFHAVENWRGERGWQEYVSTAKSRGAKVYVTEFLAPEVPAEQNFAAIPVFEEAFAAADAGKPPSDVLAFPGGKPAPSRGNMLKGERINMETWRDYFLKVGLLETAGENAAGDVLRALEKYEPIFQQLRDAAKRPASRFPVKWERGFETPASHTGVINRAGQLYALRMSALLAQGKSAAAYAEFQHGLRLYRAQEQEPSLLSGLVRQALLSSLLQALWDGLAERQWSDAELHAFMTDLASLRIIDDLRFSFDSERGTLNTQMDRFGKMSLPNLAGTIASVSGSASPGKVKSTALLIFVAYPRGWFRQNQVLMNDIYDAHLKRFDKIEAAGVASAPKDNRIESIQTSPLPRRWYYLLSTIIMPVMTTAEGRFFFAEARVQQAIAACALERYFLAYGSYPAKLEDLVPEYFEKVPRDLLANSALTYRQTPEGRYELWAVGENGEDDDGKLNQGGSIYTQPDWVWHYRKPPEPKPRKTARP